MLLFTDTNADSVHVPHSMEPEEGVALKLFKSRLPDALVNPLAENGYVSWSPVELALNQPVLGSSPRGLTRKLISKQT